MYDPASERLNNLLCLKKVIIILLNMYLVTVDLLKLCSLDTEGSYRPEKNIFINYKLNGNYSQLDTKSETALTILSVDHAFISSGSYMTINFRTQTNMASLHILTTLKMQWKFCIPWLVMSRKWELCIPSNLPGPGPVFLTPLGKRLAYSKIITYIS